MYWGGWTKEGGGQNTPPPHFPEYSQTDSVPPILLPSQEMIRGVKTLSPSPLPRTPPNCYQDRNLCTKKRWGGGEAHPPPQPPRTAPTLIRNHMYWGGGMDETWGKGQKIHENYIQIGPKGGGGGGRELFLPPPPTIHRTVCKDKIRIWS